MTYRIFILGGFLFVFACSKSASGPSNADKAKLCSDTRAQTGAALKADATSFEASVVRMALACAIACDAGDSASCATLEGDGFSYCSTTENLCKAACKELSSPSLEKAVCMLSKP
jgi:hypothetical protein